MARSHLLASTSASQAIHVRSHRALVSERRRERSKTAAPHRVLDCVTRAPPACEEPKNAERELADVRRHRASG
jgi:hypothetical protein